MQALLLAWFQKKKRSLPWRKNRDAYRVWISEIMLQQTQVNTVIPYYERWMNEFPNTEVLANAPLSRVLKAWEGLGYYRRARYLHETAKIVQKKFAGKFPDSKDELMKLPGIGRYTAGAIASIAFGKSEPVLDGNVKRILSRVFALKEAVDSSRGEKKLWDLATKLVQSSMDPGDLNQALMELGALVCLPENPKCGACPVEKVCKAHQMKKETKFPVKDRRQKIEALDTLAAIIWKKGRVLLEKQPLENRWGGLWAFPHWIYKNGEPETYFIKKQMKAEYKTRIQNLKARTEIQHGFTKYKVRLRVYEGHCRGGSCARLDTILGTYKRRPYRWVRLQQLSSLPLPRPHQKIARLLQ